MRHSPDAREYKLLLNPKRFVEAPPQTAADIFWDQYLKPLIGRLAIRNGNEPRHAGRFDYSTKRIVPATDLVGRGKKSDTTFEEDIAPLEVEEPEPGKRAVIIPAKRSTRSRFSLSTTQKLAWRTAYQTLANLSLLFPTALDIVKGSGSRPSGEIGLISRPKIYELVIGGASVRLSDDVVGDFALTIWSFGSGHSPSLVAEASFKCATVCGDMPGKAARRALDLFIGMQGLDTEHSSKTVLALPNGCQKFAT